MQTNGYYNLQDNIGLVKEDNAPEYVLTIRELLPEDKPREKLLKYGPTILSGSELLAIILSAGTRKEEVMTMSNRILKEYGEKSLLSEIDPKRLSEELKIPIVKAMQIVACSELGRRFYQKGGNRTPVIRTPKQVYEFVKDMRDLPKEHLRGLYLNTSYKVIHDEVISIGTINANIIHPREVFKPALEYSAAAVILVHNHPSGFTKPSREDLWVTKQLVDAGKLLGIDLIDHIIITKQNFASILQGSRKLIS